MTGPLHPELARLVTESKRSTDSFWGGVVDELSDAVMIVSPDRRVLYGNRKAEVLMGGPLAESEGRMCLDAISCPQCQCACRLFSEGAVSNVEVTVYVPGEDAPRTFRKNGRLIRSERGDVLGGIEVFTDVSNEARAKQEHAQRAELLCRERRRTDVLLRSVSEGVVSLDAQLRVRDFSDSASRLTGFSREEASGKSIVELFGIASAIEEPVTPASITERPVRTRIRKRDGELLDVEISFLPLRYGSDELLGLVNPVRPLTEQAEVIQKRFGFCGLLSRSSAMQQVFRLVASAAESEANILVEGESGTGKELVARAIHELGPRRASAFFAVNCATFTGSLLLSELFGHERGAFTGAVRTQRGKLELAGKGTLFLDEVQEIPIQHQALLLRVLETRKLERLGGGDTIDFEARVVAATNRPLASAVSAGLFRPDLYYRLNVVPIRIPPLRERPEDVELLATYFLNLSCRPGRAQPPELTRDALDALVAYPWPGNVRELRNTMEYLCFLGEERITRKSLPEELLSGARPSAAPLPPPALAPVDPAPATDDECQRIKDALERAHFRRAKAAELLGMDRSTLWRKLRKYGIEA
ncbi:sigma 54-interacting transcriptional regulator [Myxococcota bacterium]|nr:sigma 54-interacting transcriptional regulator [Myxococcota bacterium]